MVEYSSSYCLFINDLTNAILPVSHRVHKGYKLKLRALRRIALCHHEKYDGSGYPQQLAGESIPIEARIVAIADVFDALTSVRPYKKAWSVEAAVALLQREKGKHFDPQLVDLFIAQLPAVLQIKERYAEDGSAEPATTPPHP